MKCTILDRNIRRKPLHEVPWLMEGCSRHKKVWRSKSESTLDPWVTERSRENKRKGPGNWDERGRCHVDIGKNLHLIFIEAERHFKIRTNTLKRSVWLHYENELQRGQVEGRPVKRFLQYLKWEVIVARTWVNASCGSDKKWSLCAWVYSESRFQ